MNIPVDMVFTYIDGRDPAILKKRNEFERFYDDDEIHPERAEGKNFDMLYNNVTEITFSVRSVVKYLPWIRTIFIVTDQQVPPVDRYLLDSGRVRIVDHREILSAHYLPTFNGEVIESCLHNIQGLSEIFLYNNDDFMHFSSVKGDTFFTITDDNSISLNLYAFPSVIKFIGHEISKFIPERWPISSNYVRLISNSFSLLRNTKRYLSWHDIINPKHMTYIYRKSTALRIEQEFGDKLHQLRNQRFMTLETFLYHTILYTMEKQWHPYDTIHNHLFFDSSIRFRFFDFKSYTEASESAKIWRKVASSNANFVCLNNIRECQYESFIKAMRKKGLGDPITARSDGSSKPQQERPSNV